MIRLARKHSETGSRTVAGTMLILNLVHLPGQGQDTASDLGVELNTNFSSTAITK